MKMIFFLNKEEKHKIENHVAHNNQMVNYCCWVIFWEFNKRDNEEIALNCAFNIFVNSLVGNTKYFSQLFIVKR